jgi:hypothetical protein
MELSTTTTYAPSSTADLHQARALIDWIDTVLTVVFYLVIVIVLLLIGRLF